MIVDALANGEDDRLEEEEEELEFIDFMTRPLQNHFPHEHCTTQDGWETPQ